MARRLTAILLLFALSSTYFTRWFVLADFELNRQFIAETLCINKGRPWMHCNGHCYLMKKLNQAQEGQSREGQLIQKTLQVEACIQTYDRLLAPVRVFNRLLRPILSSELISRPQAVPLQPPRQA